MRWKLRYFQDEIEYQRKFKCCDSRMRKPIPISGQNVLSSILLDSMIDVPDVMRQLNWIWDKSDKPFSLALIRVKGLRTISVVSFSRCSNHEVEIIFCHLAKIGWGNEIG